MRLPSEAGLEDAARRFADAERRVRSLVARAEHGDRRALLVEALAILQGLEDLAAEVEREALLSYLASYIAVALLAGRDPELPGSGRADRLARGLRQRLSGVARTAAANTREAMLAASPDAAQAVTGLVDAAGRRLPIGAYADLQIQTCGRHLSSAGLGDAMRAAGGDPKVTIVGTGGDALCDRWLGKTISAMSVLPPFHPRCQCSAVPVGATTDEHVAALQAARTRALQAFYGAKERAAA